jgi:hypothetical protein
MPITETISDITEKIIKTSLMHRDETAEQALARAIAEHFPGEPIAEVLHQGELNAIKRARERQQQRDADKLVQTYPDVQGHLFGDDPVPVAWVPLGMVERKASLTDALAWARQSVARQDAEVEAHKRMLAMSEAKRQEAIQRLQQHEAAVAWCVKHGIDPSQVNYAQVHKTQAA